VDLALSGGETTTLNLLENRRRWRSATANLGVLQMPPDTLVECGLPVQAVVLVPLPVHIASS
jgi:hypothetical protein